MKERYGTLSETISALKEIGYTIDFNVDSNWTDTSGGNEKLSSDDFQIDKVFRFEGITNPDDQSVLYAISSSKFGLKGILTNGYGISANEQTDALIAKLKTNLDAQNP